MHLSMTVGVVSVIGISAKSCAEGGLGDVKVRCKVMVLEAEVKAWQRQSTT